MRVVGCVVGQGGNGGEVAAGIEAGPSCVLCSEMPGGRRTERISQRDLEVLEFVARFGVVPREVVALWAGTGRAVTAARERRLREAGLIDVLPGFGESGRIVVCSRRGLRTVCRADLRIAAFSPATLRHSSVAARVGAQLELTGHRVLSEREILAQERIEGERVFSVRRLYGSFHRPDLILLGDPKEAIEVELSCKSPRRLDELLRLWRRAVARKQFGRVRYLCSPEALRCVERAVRRTRTAACVEIAPLERRDGRLVLESTRQLSEPAKRVEIAADTSWRYGAGGQDTR